MIPFIYNAPNRQICRAKKTDELARNKGEGGIRSDFSRVQGFFGEEAGGVLSQVGVILVQLY